MKYEMGSMYENKVWTLIDLLDDRWVIKNKWIFKRKTDADSSVIIYKAWIVAKCFRQVQGVDYDEIFSLIAMLKSVRIMLAIPTFYDYKIWQMDVKLYSLMDILKKSCIWYNQKVLSILKVLKNVQAPAIHLWTSASISELEYTLG